MASARRDEAALAARIDERETAWRPAQEIGGAGAIGESGVGAEQKHQARLLIGPGRGDPRVLATAAAHALGDHRAREQGGSEGKLTA